MRCMRTKSNLRTKIRVKMGQYVVKYFHGEIEERSSYLVSCLVSNGRSVQTQFLSASRRHIFHPVLCLTQSMNDLVIVASPLLFYALFRINT